MISFSTDKGRTPWMNNPPTEKELQRLTISQLLIICRHKTYRISFKQHLIQYLLQIKKL